jgi:NADP-dependent 3-hydroxy acid dehydrogenase YdfG
MKIKPINENIFGAAKRFSDAFFDGLKSNATNKAIEVAKKNKKIPPKIVQKMSDIEQASKELEQMLRDIE